MGLDGIDGSAFRRAGAAVCSAQAAWAPRRPPFGEATLADFRARLVRAGMTTELERRTVELVRETKAFGFEQAAGLRIAIDSAPRDGAGKVEDTINLLGRSLRLPLQVIAAFLVMSPEEVAAQAHLPVLVAPDTKAGLDLDWREPNAQHLAIGGLIAKAASRELLPTRAGANSMGHGCFGRWNGSVPARVPRWFADPSHALATRIDHRARRAWAMHLESDQPLHRRPPLGAG